MTIPFVEAKWYTRTNGRNIRLLVIHDMEAPELLNTAEATAAYFHNGAGGRKASAHYCIDANSIVQCVQDKDVAYHAPGANNDGIGYEHAGYAKQSREEWMDAYSQAELRLSASLAATHCKQYNLPAEFVPAAQLPDKSKRGITTHWEVTKAFHKSDHTDPGINFPMGQYLQWVREAMGGTPPTPIPTPPSTTISEHDMWLVPIQEDNGSISWRTLTPTGLRFADTQGATLDALNGVPVYGGSVNKGIPALAAIALAKRYGAPLYTKDGTVIKT